MQELTVKQWPIYTWLITLYPILYLYSLNSGLVRFAEVWPIVVVSMAVVTAVFLALRALLKDGSKAGAVSAVLSFAFFSYGQIYDLVSFRSFLKNLQPSQKHLALLVMVGIVTVVVIAIIVRKEGNLQKATHILNLMTIVLIAIPVATLSLHLFWHLKRDPPIPDPVVESPSEFFDPETLPDIYFIILDLDRYPRNDELLEIADFDNGEFLAALEERGFYIAYKAMSNYSKTPTSLASSLNMQYLDSFAGIREGRLGFRHINPWIKDHIAGRAFMERGYTYVHISSGWPPSDVSLIADINIEFTIDGVVYYEKEDNSTSDPSNIKVFLPLLLGTTLLRPVLPPLYPTHTVLAWFDPDRTLQTFEVLADIPDIEEPTFTFLHMVKPHAPYMFDRYGNVIEKPPGWTIRDEENYISWPKSFVDQLVFVNTMTLATVDQILTKSEVPPIIIQADHGHNSNRILSAYYLPGGGDDLLYPPITPVNNFRLILDYYFGTDLGLLEDRSYFVAEGFDPCNFTEVKIGEED